MSAEETVELALLTKQLEELNRIGAALSAERDTRRLLELILTKARAITGSDAGSLYVVEPLDDRGEDGIVDGREPPRRLRFMIAQNDSVSVPFKENVLEIDDVSIAGHVALTGEIVRLEDAYTLPADVRYSFSRSFDETTGYRTRSVLAAPLQTPKGHVVGVVQLINAKRDPDARLDSPAAFDAHVVPFTARHDALVTSLAGQAAIALENSQLYTSIRQLFEGFVRASVVAIESRDPATSGHSFRVTNLTIALAEAVDRAAGPFAGVQFSRDDMRTMRYACLLHDFGKVGVRDEVLVKAKKLYPAQLALIRERFKLARRSRELDSLRERHEYLLAEGPSAYRERKPAFEAALEAELAALDGYLAEIGTANEPTPVPEGHFERLRDIAAVAFEDVDGRRPLLDEDEVRLLSLRKGSLSEEERVEIESHVVHTFNFLKQIPWTAEIRRIPSIALGHHEMLNGTGYPRRLSGAGIPIQTRMLTICDIFDALSAADRPYKKAVPIERAVQILGAAVSDGQLDADVFALFMEARVFDRWHVEPHAY